MDYVGLKNIAQAIQLVDGSLRPDRRYSRYRPRDDLQFVIVPLVKFNFMAMRAQQCDFSINDDVFSTPALVRIMGNQNFHKIDRQKLQG
jgi:hypothetical protein